MLAVPFPAWTPHPEVWLLVALFAVGYALAVTRLGPRLAPNQSLGYRKINATSGSWIARLKKDGRRTYQALGLESEFFGFEQVL